MSTESMKALARKRAQHDYKPRKGTSEEPVPTYSSKKHSNADVIKGRNERRMGHGEVDVTMGDIELESAKKEPYVEVTGPSEIELEKVDHKREGAYPAMPEPKDRSHEPVKKRKFSMLKSLLGHMNDMDK